MRPITDILEILACDAGMFGCPHPAQFQKRMYSFAYATSLNWTILFSLMPSLGWVVTSISELILFVLVLKKAGYNFLCRRKSNLDAKHHIPDVMTILARDSTIYFVV